MGARVTLSTPVDLVKCVVTSTGSGPFALGTALPAFRGVEALIDGETYSYSVQLGANFEYGQGLYSAGSVTLTRGVTGSSRGGLAVEFGPGAVVTFTLSAADLLAAGFGSGVRSVTIEGGTSGLATAGTQTGAVQQQIVGVLALDHGGTGATDAAAARAALGIGGGFRYFGSGYDAIQNNETLLRFATPDALTIAADLAGWAVVVTGTAPTASFVLTVAAGGATLGTISIAAGSGVVTLATVGGIDQSVGAFSEITITAPANAVTVGVGLIVTITGIGAL